MAFLHFFWTPNINHIQLIIIDLTFFTIGHSSVLVKSSRRYGFQVILRCGSSRSGKIKKKRNVIDNRIKKKPSHVWTMSNLLPYMKHLGPITLFVSFQSTYFCLCLVRSIDQHWLPCITVNTTNLHLEKKTGWICILNYSLTIPNSA